MLFFDCTNMTCFFSYLVSKLTTLKLPRLNKTLFKRKQADYLKYSEEPYPAQFKENTWKNKWVPGYRMKIYIKLKQVIISHIYFRIAFLLDETVRDDFWGILNNSGFWTPRLIVQKYDFQQMIKLHKTMPIRGQSNRLTMSLSL